MKLEIVNGYGPGDTVKIGCITIDDHTGKVVESKAYDHGNEEYMEQFLGCDGNELAEYWEKYAHRAKNNIGLHAVLLEGRWPADGSDDNNSAMDVSVGGVSYAPDPLTFEALVQRMRQLGKEDGRSLAIQLVQWMEKSPTLRLKIPFADLALISTWAHSP